MSNKPSKTQVLWVSGQSLPTPKHITLYELQCNELHIDSYDYPAIMASPEMLSWIQSNKDTKYIPSKLLRKLGKDGLTVWDTPEPRHQSKYSVDAEFEHYTAGAK